MRKGFTFQQIAMILLALIILIALIVVVMIQKDQIAETLSNIFGAGETATEGLNDAVGELLGMTIPIILWQVKKQ